MKYFVKHPSERFTTFVRESRKHLGCNIRFLTMEGHPAAEKTTEDAFGASLMDEEKNELIVHVNTTLVKKLGLPPECSETIAAHEIMHGYLNKEGFPITKRPPQKGPESKAARIGGQLHSVVHHVCIDDRLIKLGFDPLVIKDFDGSKFLENARKRAYGVYTFEQPGFVRAALSYIDNNLRCSPGLCRNIRQALAKDNIDIVEIGDKCLKIIKGTDCTNPSGALMATVAIRDIFCLKDKGIYVVDPISGRVF